MFQPAFTHLPTLPHAGFLREQLTPPTYQNSPSESSSWSFYAQGVRGQIVTHQENYYSEAWNFKPGKYVLRCYYLGQLIEQQAILQPQGWLETSSTGLISSPGAVFLAELEKGAESWTVLLGEKQTLKQKDSYQQHFLVYRTVLQRSAQDIVTEQAPSWPVRLKISLGDQRTVFPLQLAPSVLDLTGRRVSLKYEEAIERLAELLLNHRPPYGRTLVYADGQLDYFGCFALQEVGRLLNIRNLYGSTIWGAQALAAGAELQRGNSLPLSTLEEVESLSKPLYLLNGWNGFLSHPLVFERLLKHHPQQVWLIDVMVTETAQVVAEQAGIEQVLLIRPGAESHLALAIAHQLLTAHAAALPEDLAAFADMDSYADFASLVKSDIFAPEKVVELLVPEPQYAERLLKGIQAIAAQLADPESSPVHIPGINLLQSGGTAAYCLWSNLFAMLGKWTPASSGPLRGAELQLFNPANEALQLQHLGPAQFFGSLPMTQAGCEAAAERMGLPGETYLPLLKEPVRPIQEFPEPSHASQRELILLIGDGMEARWIRDQQLWENKLKDRNATLVVIDSLPGPFLLQRAALCLPTPPEISAVRLNCSGLGKFELQPPRRQAPPQTRSEATLLYDLMAEISRLMRSYQAPRLAHPDLAALVESGYLQSRFEPPEWGGGGQLPRQEGEVSRELLWERIQTYLSRLAPLLSSISDKQTLEPLPWSQLQTDTSAVTARPVCQNVAGEPQPFRFFSPQESDFELPAGILLTIGSTLPQPTHAQVAFCLDATQNQRLLEHPEMPKQRLLYISQQVAESEDLKDGDKVCLQAANTPDSPAYPVKISSWLKGKMIYFDHYLSQDELAQQQPFPWMHFQTPVCPYSQIPLLQKLQLSLKKEPPDDRSA